jgi:hypothetical protein
MIRLNTNFIILFKLNPRNLSDVYNSIVGSAMDKKEFLQLAQNVFSKKYQYVAINKEEDKIITDIFTDNEDSEDSDD